MRYPGYLCTIYVREVLNGTVCTEYGSNGFRRRRSVDKSGTVVVARQDFPLLRRMYARAFIVCTVSLPPPCPPLLHVGGGDLPPWTAAATGVTYKVSMKQEPEE